MIAFFFGTISHGVADVAWHALKYPQGFIAAEAQITFKGKKRLAHDLDDTGADFNLFGKFDVSYLLASAVYNASLLGKFLLIPSWQFIILWDMKS